MSPDERPDPVVMPSAPSEPKTMGEVFDFYYKYVKILYSYVQTFNTLPQETLFEINAAFDHIARHWAGEERESEASVVKYAFGHLKRSCLDVFKIQLKRMSEYYKELSVIDTSIIDNGEFDKKMRAAVYAIRMKAINARRLEGRANSTDGKVCAFEPWAEVFNMCLAFEKEFYLSEKIEWARKKQSEKDLAEKRKNQINFWWGCFVSFIIGIVTSVVGAYCYEWIKSRKP
jgi:hypothetical protein